MPEGPEVQRLVDHLSQYVLGSRYTSMFVCHSSFSRRLEIPDGLEREMASSEVQFSKVSRRGKYILFEFASSDFNPVILSHLGFTGWWTLSWAPPVNNDDMIHKVSLKDTRLVLYTDNGRMIYTDPRTLGRLYYFRSLSDAQQSKYLVNMAPGLETPEGKQRLIVTLPKTGRRIRDVLLDQKIGSSIGNYLVAEILYVARLNGHEKAKGLNLDQRSRLFKAIDECFALASATQSRDWWRVFRRKTCPEGHPITREVWGSRGHYTCMVCAPRDGSF
jgi:formamidopyrimidine-DNA glycosylase